MRLLHTREARFQEFVGRPGTKDFPKYAILSHRWTNEEITHQEMEFLLLNESDRARVLTPRLLNTASKTSSQGYQKVMRFCEVAAADGYDWTWIDTVCIDNTSSSELSEAINSMWPWYKYSNCCYAYLGDVESCSGHNKRMEQAHWTRDSDLRLWRNERMEHISTSEYWTRGKSGLGP